MRRTEFVETASVSPAECSSLTRQLHEIYCETVRGDSRDDLVALLFGAGEVRVALFYGARDELAGFSYSAVSGRALARLRTR